MTAHFNVVTGKLRHFWELVGESGNYHVTRQGRIVPKFFLYPQVYDDFRAASLDLNFAKKRTLKDQASGNNPITFSRASSGTYVGSDGLIKTSPVNLLTYSEQFESWDAGSNTTVIPNAALAPDGSMTADKIYLPEAGGTYIRQLNATVGIENTFSIWVKAVTPGTNDKFNIQIGDFSSSDFTSTEEWQRFSFTKTPLSSKAAIFNEGDNFISNIYVWGAQLEESSAATDYIPTGATISGAPRFDHDPVTGESLGLLIEEGRTNLLTYSEQFDQWSKGSATVVTSNTIAAPDGTLTADKVYLPSSGTRYIAKSVTLTQGKTYTFSVYAKAVTPGTNNVFLPRIGSPSPKSPSSDFVATSEWQRFVFTFTHTDVTASTNIFPLNINGPYIIDLYLWGAQIERGSFPTSYIPTTNSTVTRSPDIATIEGTNFSSWYNQSEGTVFSDVNPLSADSGRAYVFSDGTVFKRISHSVTASSGFALFIRSGSTTTSLATAVSGLPKPLKAGIAYRSGSSRGVIDGVLKTLSATSAVPSTIDQVSIGSQNFSSSDYLNGHISRLAYFPTRKTDQELIKITDGTLDLAIITYGITSAGGTFNLRSAGTVDYAVDWDSTGGYESSTSNTLAHTYTAGNYDLVVYSDGVYRPYFNNVTADASQITSVVIGPGADLGTNLESAWWYATNMTSFVCPFDVTSGVTNFKDTWRDCDNLTSFPLIDTAAGTSFDAAWRKCSSLTSFPLIDTAAGTSFSSAWRGCSNLTSFPLINTSSGTNFTSAWYNCNSLTSFPLIDISSGTTFTNAWNNCNSLTSFPLIDISSGINFKNAWRNCALTAQSIENILVSLDTNGASGISLGIDGGTNAAKTTWSTAAVTAYDNLIVKGWSISFNA